VRITEVTVTERGEEVMAGETAAAVTYRVPTVEPVIVIVAVPDVAVVEIRPVTAPDPDNLVKERPPL
jgi:hypothetical protein